MKISTILRLAALVVLGAVLLMWAGALSAADPAGDSPKNGIPQSSAPYEICSTQTLAPGAQVWLKVPYHAGKDLEMHVKTADGLHFDVYDPSQVTNWPTLPPQPIGRLLPDPNEPGYTDTWKGHLVQSDFYYVLVTNPSGLPVTFSFCTIETDLFVPPAMVIPPTISTTTLTLDDCGDCTFNPIRNGQ